jgi:hypothetical protein
LIKNYLVLLDNGEWSAWQALQASAAETIAASVKQQGLIEAAANQGHARSCNGDIPQRARDACTIAALQNEQI